MFVVVYSFTIIEGKENQFELAWREMTDLIKKYEGGLGSRLHKESSGKYIAYAQWPNKELWEGFGRKLPIESKEVSARMKDSIIESKTVYEMYVSDDRLIKE